MTASDNKKKMNKLQLFPWEGVAYQQDKWSWWEGFNAQASVRQTLSSKITDVFMLQPAVSYQTTAPNYYPSYMATNDCTARAKMLGVTN